MSRRRPSPSTRGRETTTRVNPHRRPLTGSLSRVVVLATWLAALPSGAAAHPTNVAFARITLHDRAVDVELSANLFELDLVLGLDQDLSATVATEELEAKRPEIIDYLRRSVTVTAGGQAVPMAVGRFAVVAGPDGKPLFETTLQFASNRPLTDVTIRCEPLTELGADHATLATITSLGSRVGTSAGKTVQFAFRKGVTYSAQSASGRASFARFLQLGIVHIFTGYDHVAFLVGLLVRGGGLLTIIKIVTAFTVAHSLTLSLATLGAVHIPPGPIEAAIALSIVYVAAENLFREPLAGGRRDAASAWTRGAESGAHERPAASSHAGAAPRRDHRWIVSFVFGLVHGFGFAGALSELGLSRGDLVGPLLAFNLGVELGQLAVVALVVPLLWRLARLRAYPVLIRSVSVVLLSLGLLWFYQRVLA